MNKKLVSTFIGCMSALVFCQNGFAANSGFYAALDAGVIQANFNQSYLDQTDIILQNIQQTVQQNGYTEGLAIGYSKVFYQQYLLGAELSGNLDSNQSTYQSGASTSAFSDTIQIRNHVDLTVVPGILLTDSLTGYLKAGVSFANLRDNLNTPTGYTPTSANFTTQRTLTGFVAGLGLRKYVTKNISLFAEGNYHDYGTVNLSGFQNFTANYTHTAHVYVSTVTVGAAYHF